MKKRTGVLAAVYIRLDKQFNTYNRQVSDLLDLLATIGGLQKALFATGMMIVSYVSQKIFSANIVHQLF
jgi:hypothetical protein